jgi:hypothetical protein
MPPTVEDRLRDIFEAIAEIEDVTRGMSISHFASDRRTRLLIERYSKLSVRRRGQSLTQSSERSLTSIGER